MDRRMYRGYMGSRNAPARPNDPAYTDMTGGFTPEDMGERDRYEGEFDRFPIGMCYVPWQRFRDLYENEFVALANGTIFKELNLEWYGRGCK